VQHNKGIPENVSDPIYPFDRIYPKAQFVRPWPEQALDSPEGM
jgi:hypothetical protein